MPSTRTDEFRSKDVKLANMAKAIAHPARVAILRMLAKKNSCVCGEIVDELPIAQATVSQHLKELKNAGLVSGTVEGPASCYCLDQAAIDKLASGLNSLFDELREGCSVTSCSTKGGTK